MTVFDFVGSTVSASMFNALFISLVRFALYRYSVELMIHTWHYLDVVGRMHRHHFGVDPDSIVVEWI